MIMQPPLEQLLIPSIHDGDYHETVVCDEEAQTRFCLECALECLKANDLLVVRKRRLLRAVDSALERLSVACDTDDSDSGSFMESGNRCEDEGLIMMVTRKHTGPQPVVTAANRILPSFLQYAILQPMGGNERAEVVPALLKTSMRLFTSVTWDDQVLASVYGPLLDTCRAQGTSESLHLIQLLSAMLNAANDNGSIPHLDCLLEGGHEEGGDGEEGVEGGLFDTTSRSFTSSFVAFVDMLASECVTIGLRSSPSSNRQRHQSLFEEGGEEKHVELLHLLLLLVQAPRTKTFLLETTDILPRHLNQMHSLAHLAQGPSAAAGLGRGVTGVWVKNLLALALLLLHSRSSSSSSSSSSTTSTINKHNYNRRKQHKGGGAGEGGKEGVLLLLQYHTTIATTLAKHLLISADMDLAVGAASYLLRLLRRLPVAAITAAAQRGEERGGGERGSTGGDRAVLADAMLQSGIVEYCLEGLRNALASSSFYHHNCHHRQLQLQQQQQQQQQQQCVRLTHRLCRLLWALSKAEPLVFFSPRHFCPLLMQELVALLQRLKFVSTAGGGGRDDEEEANVYQAEEDWIEEEVEGGGGSAPILVLDILRASMTQTRMIYDEEITASLLQMLDTLQQAEAAVAAAAAGQPRFALHLLLFMSEYLGAISNKLLFPSTASLDHYLLGLRQQLQLALLSTTSPPSPPSSITIRSTSSYSRPTPLLILTFASIRVLDILAVRQHQQQHQQQQPLFTGLNQLSEAAFQLLALFDVTSPRTAGEEYAVCRFFLELFLTTAATSATAATTARLRRSLLEAGVLEIALLHLGELKSMSGGEEGEREGGEEEAQVFSRLVMVLLQEETGVGKEAGGARLLLQFVQQDLKPSIEASLSHKVSELWAWLLMQDMRGFCRWSRAYIEVEGREEGRERGVEGGLWSRFELLLALSLCFRRRVGPTDRAATTGVHHLLILWGELQGQQQEQQQAYLGRTLSPLSIKLLIDLVFQSNDNNSINDNNVKNDISSSHSSAADTPPLLALPISLQPGLQTALHAFTVTDPTAADTYCSLFFPPSHAPALLPFLALGHGPGAQCIVHRWLARRAEEGGKEGGKEEDPVWATALRLYFEHAGGEGSAVLLALLEYLRAAPPVSLLRRLPHAMAAFKVACAWPGLWSSCVKVSGKVLGFLHDNVLPALVQDEEGRKERGLPVEIVLVATAALRHANWNTHPGGFGPVVKLASRLLLLVSSPPPVSLHHQQQEQQLENPAVVAALLSLTNQLVVYGQGSFFLSQHETILELAWSFQRSSSSSNSSSSSSSSGSSSSSSAVMANGLVYCVLLLHHYCLQVQQEQLQQPPPPTWLSHPFFSLPFLQTCLEPCAEEAPEQQIKKAALALLCRLYSSRHVLPEGEGGEEDGGGYGMKGEDGREEMNGGGAERDVGEKDRGSYMCDTTDDRRRLRLQVQTCVLDRDPSLRECALALLLQLWDSSSPTAWDLFLLRSPSFHSCLSLTLYAPLYVAACIMHPSEAGAAEAAVAAVEPGVRFSLDRLLHTLLDTTRQVAAGERDSLPAWFPSVLFLLRALVRTGRLTRRQRELLHLALNPSSDDSSISSSSRRKKVGERHTLVLGDARLVDYEEEVGLEEGQKVGMEVGKDVWFPPCLLAMYIHDGDNGQSAKYLKKMEERGKEEGEELPAHPRKVGLKRVLEDLQTRT